MFIFAWFDGRKDTQKTDKVSPRPEKRKAQKKDAPPCGDASSLKLLANSGKPYRYASAFSVGITET